MEAQSERRETRVDAERCAGCLMCQLRCSYRFTGAFNLAESRIEILRRPEGKREFTVAFREGCDQCGLCANHCTYGALTRRTLE